MKTKKILYPLCLSLALTVLLSVEGCRQTPKAPVHAKIVMKKYSITPAETRVKQGDMIQFDVSTLDVQHGFNIPDLGISEPIQPGKPAIFMYTVAKKGTFNIECNIICGSGHDDMRAKLLVE